MSLNAINRGECVSVCVCYFKKSYVSKSFAYAMYGWFYAIPFHTAFTASDRVLPHRRRRQRWLRVVHIPQIPTHSHVIRLGFICLYVWRLLYYLRAALNTAIISPP